MTDHEDLLRSLLVERYRPWRPDADRDLPARSLAKELARESRRRQEPAYRSQRSQTTTSEGRRTT